MKGLGRRVVKKGYEVVVVCKNMQKAGNQRDTNL